MESTPAEQSPHAIAFVLIPAMQRDIATLSASLPGYLEVHKGRLYILETPLFRVRNKKETAYCYSEAERNQAIERLDKAEVTRFKGLGEINPREFKRFIGPDMRLQQVAVPDKGQVGRSLSFFMGKNTPERRRFIVDGLISEASW